MHSQDKEKKLRQFLDNLSIHSEMVKEALQGEKIIMPTFTERNGKLISSWRKF